MKSARPLSAGPSSQRPQCYWPRIRKSFAFLPDRSCAVSQRGCLPRPDQVSAGFFGFRYLGRTFGYGRRWRSEVIALLTDPSLCNRSSSLVFSIANSRVNLAVTCSWSSHRSSMAIDFKSLFSIGPTVREAGCPHRGAPHLNSNRRAEQPIVYFLKTECGCFMEPSPAGTGGTLLLGTSYHTLPKEAANTSAAAPSGERRPSAGNGQLGRALPTPFKKVAVAKDWASRCPEATVVTMVQSTPREGS